MPGLFVGCLLANFLAGAAWYDVVFGSLATLIAAILTRKLRSRFALAALMPVLLNGLIVGPVVYFAYNYAGTFSLPAAADGHGQRRGGRARRLLRARHGADLRAEKDAPAALGVKKSPPSAKRKRGIQLVKKSF